jgi:FkbM family methyltransferase
MRRRVARAVNFLLAPFGARVVGAAADTSAAPFDMRSAIRRIAGHGLPVRSVIDIGASDGTWSLDAMASFPTASFLAVEPLRERQEALERLRRRHRNFDYALCAAGETDGSQVTLDVAGDLDGSTVGGQGGSPRCVPVTTVDALVAKHRLDGPFLLKFDTHGYELPILAGARETLASTSVIVMEVYNFQITEHALRFPAMCAHLEGLGFRCCDIAGLLLRRYDRSFWQMDLLFARSDAGIFAYTEYR